MHRTSFAGFDDDITLMIMGSSPTSMAIFRESWTFLHLADTNNVKLTMARIDKNCPAATAA